MLPAPKLALEFVVDGAVLLATVLGGVGAEDVGSTVANGSDQ